MTIAKKFRDLSGLQLVLQQELQELGKAQQAAMDELTRLQVKPRMPTPHHVPAGGAPLHVRVLELACCASSCGVGASKRQQPMLFTLPRRPCLQSACQQPSAALVELAATCSR